jgi:hypothetical protein
MALQIRSNKKKKPGEENESKNAAVRFCLATQYMQAAVACLAQRLEMTSSAAVAQAAGADGDSMPHATVADEASHATLSS